MLYVLMAALDLLEPPLQPVFIQDVTFSFFNFSESSLNRSQM